MMKRIPCWSVAALLVATSPATAGEPGPGEDLAAAWSLKADGRLHEASAAFERARSKAASSRAA